MNETLAKGSNIFLYDIHFKRFKFISGELAIEVCNARIEQQIITNMIRYQMLEKE